MKMRTSYVAYALALSLTWAISLFIIDRLDRTDAFEPEILGTVGLCTIVTLSCDTFGLHRRVWFDQWRRHRRLVWINLLVVAAIFVLMFAGAQTQSTGFERVSGLAVWATILNAGAALALPVRLLVEARRTTT